MGVMVWNVRGLGKLARRRQIREYIFQGKIDVVELQETVKEDFFWTTCCRIFLEISFSLGNGCQLEEGLEVFSWNQG